MSHLFLKGAWRSYLYALLPPQEHRSVLERILEEHGGQRERMTIQTDAVYRMLTWEI